MSWPAIIFLALSSVSIVAQLIKIGAAETNIKFGGAIGRLGRESTLLLLAYLGGLFG